MDFRGGRDPGAGNRARQHTHEEESTREVYTVDYPDYWTRYTSDEDGDTQIAIGLYHDEYMYFDREGAPTPPLLRVELPWEARFGKLVAEAHRAI